MARGWESKNVEEQVQTKVESEPGQKAPGGRGAKTREQQAREQDLQQLQLSRTRIVNDLANATHPNHKKTLEAALAHLDKKIAEIV
jgi:hypothetical protein